MLLSRLTVDILSTFCGVFIVQCVKLILRIYEFGVLLCDCFVYRQKLTCLIAVSFQKETENSLIPAIILDVIL